MVSTWVWVWVGGWWWGWAVGCGGLLTSERGIISTPHFPGRFPVPARCRWVVDASSRPPNTNIQLHLTQVFVSTGLTVSEFAYYERDGGLQYGGTSLLAGDDSSLPPAQLFTPMPYLVVDLALDRLESNHLRVLDHLLDVFGLNMTYEMTTAQPVNSCSPASCSMLGHCYASHDYKKYWCACFPGYSGKDCSQGPLCSAQSNPCQNGATCRQVGAESVRCHCTPGQAGTYCETSVPLQECRDEIECLRQCPFNGKKENVCNCDNNSSIVPRDLSHFKCSLRLVNYTSLTDHPKQLQIRLQKLLSKHLRSFNLTKIDGLRIINLRLDLGEFEFAFTGAKGEGSRVREALSRLAERPRLGNLTLLPTHFSFKQEPTLLLQSVRVNHKEGTLREGEPLIVTCLAQGSSNLTFLWYHQGARVNTSLATRNMSVVVEHVAGSDQLASRLVIWQAQRLDGGRFTCQALDHGLQQCYSVMVSVVSPLAVSVLPTSTTVPKGGNTTLRCLTSGHPPATKFGYNWSKNRALFPMNISSEYWEDLYPDGSILRIYNVQRSVTYTCQVQGGVWSGEGQGRVEAGEGRAGCPRQASWPASPPAALVHAPCPPGHVGHASRYCLLLEPGKARWQTPDYSACLSRTTKAIINNFGRLRLGYEVTTVGETVFEAAAGLQGRGPLKPGEGEPLVALLASVLDYLQATAQWRLLTNTTSNFLSAVGALLTRNGSIINQQELMKLQSTVMKWAQLWSRHTGGTFNHEANSGVLVETIKVLPLQRSLTWNVPRPGLTYPSWLEPVVVRVELEATDQESEEQPVAVLVAYRHLASFIPHHLTQKTTEGSETEVGVGSPVVSVAGPGLSASVTLTPGPCLWAHPDRPSAWSLAPDCTASLPALIAPANTLLQHLHKKVETSQRTSAVVAIGCCCCLVQSLVTLVLLVIRWWHHKTCLLFIKAQCCLSTLVSMATFAYLSKNSILKENFLISSVCLQLFVLVTISSQLSKLVIVYSELLNIPRVKHFRVFVLTIITGMCVVCSLCGALVQSFSREPAGWWLVYGTNMFNMTASYAALLVFMYVVIGTDLACKLTKLLKEKNPKLINPVTRRTGLVKRSVAVLVSTVAMTACSVLYANNPGIWYQNAFALSSAVMGSTLFACYVVLSETFPKHPVFLKKLRVFGTDQDYSTESDNSFFTKQEGEAEGEGAAPGPDLALEKVKQPLTPRKNVTFHSDLVTGCSVIEDTSGSSCGSPERAEETPCRHLDLVVGRADSAAEPPTENPWPPQVYPPGDVTNEVLCRISHDLNYLLNSDNDPPTPENEDKTPL